MKWNTHYKEKARTLLMEFGKMVGTEPVKLHLSNVIELSLLLSLDKEDPYMSFSPGDAVTQKVAPLFQRESKMGSLSARCFSPGSRNNFATAENKGNCTMGRICLGFCVHRIHFFTHWGFS